MSASMFARSTAHPESLSLISQEVRSSACGDWGLNWCAQKGQGLNQHSKEPGQGLSCGFPKVRAKGACVETDCVQEDSCYHLY